MINTLISIFLIYIKYYYNNMILVIYINILYKVMKSKVKKIDTH